MDHPIALKPGTSDAEYLHLLRDQLPAFLDAVVQAAPIGLAIYNAGTDVYRDDQLGGLAMSDDAIVERDRFVMQSLSERAIPWLMLPSGGYSQASHRILAMSVAEAIERWG
ncbi:MAG: hypothetical protein GC162_13020 [Planctomycetes bacterium]|nr:hypothetical protein [Planctomycetota bacterium]